MCAVQLPVWPATVDRLRSPILYSVHGCGCKNASPGLCYLQFHKNVYSHWSSELLCSPALQYTLQVPRSLLLCHWQRVAMSHPGEWQLAALRQTEVGRLGAVTMTSHFGQPTRIQIGMGMKVTGLNANAEKPFLAKLRKQSWYHECKCKLSEPVYVWYKITVFF